MKKGIIRSGIIAGLLLAAAVLAGQASPITNSNLPPDDIKLRSAWLTQVSENRNQSILVLMNLVSKSKAEDSEVLGTSRLWYSVRALGVLHAEEAVPALMEMIELPMLLPVHALVASQDSEVIHSLALIGKSSSRLAVEYLANDKSSERMPRYLRVIYLVEGPDVGKFMLELAAKNEKDPDKKARLEKAIELFANADKIVP